jgi:hypothetical protein
LFPHDLRQTLVTDFFGGVAQVETTHSTRGNDTVEWNESHAKEQHMPRDHGMLDQRNTSLPEAITLGHDLRAPTIGPKQDWIVLVVLVGLLWVLRRESSRIVRNAAYGKGKTE